MSLIETQEIYLRVEGRSWERGGKVRMHLAKNLKTCRGELRMGLSITRHPAALAPKTNLAFYSSSTHTPFATDIEMSCSDAKKEVSVQKFLTMVT